MRIKFTGYVGHIILNGLFQWVHISFWVANSPFTLHLSTDTHTVTHTLFPVLSYPDDKPISLF